ncbi:sperm-associated antigen 17 [Limosa lapponica baueri]|uniref:Sperm-associated antigen 17 n=1 Tax=Limosa lapponica baueri TaxID=1758121 RepID=A0A2I0TBN0_LIMLA|nr:sperm-associated antigen 17 [Limosa lapponica baueri]
MSIRLIKILFADGTVSKSPDSGPVLPPPTIPDNMQPIPESEPPPDTSTKKDEPLEAITRKVKCMQVENPEFATVITNCEDGTCCTIFGDGTSIIAKPQGTYQVLPIKTGSLFIDEDCSAVYTHEVNDFISKKEEKQAGRYIMKHTSSTICEMMDPNGNLFKVMADGSTSVCVPSIDSDDKEDRSSASALPEVNKPLAHDEHVPRFFIIYADGSGTELLRSRDVHEYLAKVCSDPSTAVLQDPVQERPDMQTKAITKCIDSLLSKSMECVTVFINHIALFINEDNDTLMLTLSLAVGKDK